MLKEPPPPSIPYDDMFYSELAYAGNDNHVYLKVQSEPFKSKRLFLLGRLHMEYAKKPHTPIPLEEIKPLMYVVIQSPDETFNFFYRAKVISVDEANLVHCLKIDEGSTEVVLPSRVFRMTPQILETEVMVLKCLLDGMDIFDGLPNIQMIYNLVRMAEINPEAYYATKITNVFDRVPVIRMLWRGGATLTSAVQRWIPNFCAIPKLKIGDEIQATVVYVDWRGRVWLQPTERNDFINRIQGTLQSFSYDKIPKAFGVDTSAMGRFSPRKVATLDAWKRRFFTVPTGVYISKYYKDDLYYRCILTKSINKEKVEVEFIDFGNIEAVYRYEMFNCKDVDENLAYIPPQCIKAHLSGVKEMDDLWFSEQAVGTITAKVVEEAGDGKFGIGVEIYKDPSEPSLNHTLNTMNNSKFTVRYINKLRKRASRYNYVT